MKIDLIYLLSGKNGIAPFTQRELELLAKNNIKFKLCFTQLNNLVPSQISWPVYVFNPFDIFLAIIRNFFTLIKNGVLSEVVRNGEYKSLLTAVCFYEKTKKNKPSIIHVQMGDHKLFIGYYLKKLYSFCKLTTTIHAHELYFEKKDRDYFRFITILKSCEKLFTISEFNKDLLVHSFQLRPEIIDVMYLYPSIEPVLKKDTIKILIVGNWERKKGFEDIIEAIKKIKEDNYIIYVAGTNVNPDVDLNLPELIRKNDIEDKFVLLGRVSSSILEVLYNFCDIFLLPSKTEFFENGNVKEREGIPVALMEAMYFGMPVITTNHAGIPELINENLIEEGNVKQLAHAIKNSLINLSTLKINAKNNIEIVKNKFHSGNINKMLAYFAKNKF